MKSTPSSSDEKSARLAQLQAVVDHGIYLATLGDRALAFSTVLKQARALLGADLSYVSLNDGDARTTSIQAVDGVLTPQFRHISMPLGTGLLGQVAESDHPMQTRDYLADSSLVPYPENDAKVGGEHVHAIMGVPLRCENITIGALVVADRYAHEFTAFQVDLLRSLAGQLSAYLAVEDSFATMRADHTSASERIDSLTVELRAARLEATVSRLAGDAMARKITVAEYVRALGAHFEQKIDLLGIDGWQPALVASAEGMLDVLATSAEAIVTVTNPALEGGEGVMARVEVDPHATAVLVLHGDVPEWKREALTRAADAVANLALAEQHAAEQATRDVRELIDYLTRSDQTIDRLSARTRLAHFGVDVGLPLHVTVIRSNHASTARIASALRRVVNPPTLLSEHGDHVCALLPRGASANPQAISEALSAEGVDAAVGMAGPEPLPDRLPGQHELARAVSDALINLGRVPAGATQASMGVLGALIGVDTSALIRVVIDTALGRLLEYDKSRGTSLVETLERYLDSGQRLQETADAMHLHVNTLRQRLTRIDSVLGENWRTPMGAFDLTAVLKARRLTQQSAVGG
ncbi:helix-turn-helix domain-containing protein [Microbacterium trichothecenolyticum]|uniref:Helix-turn-helix domain-containing protein n=1 Tax=Microbacterium ureisolvens TaxID=2781186 RepID=A0ABS7I3N9_9MICO|nr:MULTISPECIES: helix-turn-helix domain-containing protein [Microbacterium]MBW9111903.1 helix-turn-helix domain-containing protein [Microbacterium ureisolvens]MBW9122250.1 helix-turn-helix domain-containing protein [Microbacterium trichothecenolyticum]